MSATFDDLSGRSGPMNDLSTVLARLAPFASTLDQGRIGRAAALELVCAGLPAHYSAASQAIQASITINDARRFGLLCREEQAGAWRLSPEATALLTRPPGDLVRVDAVREALRTPWSFQELEGLALVPGSREVTRHLRAVTRMSAHSRALVARAYRLSVAFLRGEEAQLGKLQPLEGLEEPLRQIVHGWERAGRGPFSIEWLADFLELSPYSPQGFRHAYHTQLALEQHGLLDASGWPLLAPTPDAAARAHSGPPPAVPAYKDN